MVRHDPKCIKSWNGPVYLEDSNEFYEDIHELINEMKQPPGPVYICKSARLGEDTFWVPTNIQLILDKYVTA